MVRVAGSADRLRPHVKTHKSREIIEMQQAAGINRFKCATIAEAEMLGLCKVEDALLAYQPSGPNIERLFELIRKFPETRFSTLVDNQGTVKQLEAKAAELSMSLGLFIDVDAGMNRTGILPGTEAINLLATIQNSDHLVFRGWHVYDGHIRHPKFDNRVEAVKQAYSKVAAMFDDSQPGEIVAGGTPTFPVHAMNPQVTLSPGTCLLWDNGYSAQFNDLDFQHAAVLLTRVISKPDKGLMCLDLGHKAVAAEMPHPRVYFPELPQVEFLGQSEEHLVIGTPEVENYQVGDIIYGIPTHICPTTALHQEMVVVKSGMAMDRWAVFARNRRITV